MRFLCGAVLAFSAVTMCSCEATNSLAKVRENPDDPEGPPIAAGRVTQVVIVAPRGEFFDSDGNGFRDSTRIVAFLFDEFSTGKTVAVGGDGTLRILLVGDNGERLASWMFPITPDRGMMEQTSYGWGYVIDLDINDVATDQFPHHDGALAAIYTPADGSRSATTSGPAAVLVGPTFE